MTAPKNPDHSPAQAAYWRKNSLAYKRARALGGQLRAIKLSPTTRRAIAQAGYQKMMESRCTRLLESILFDINHQEE
jgi:hypothetical protein